MGSVSDDQFAALGTLGHSGTLTDRQYAYLKAQGQTGSRNDMLRGLSKKVTDTLIELGGGSLVPTLPVTAGLYLHVDPSMSSYTDGQSVTSLTDNVSSQTISGTGVAYNDRKSPSGKAAIHMPRFSLPLTRKTFSEISIFLVSRAQGIGYTRSVILDKPSDVGGSDYLNGLVMGTSDHNFKRMWSMQGNQGIVVEVPNSVIDRWATTSIVNKSGVKCSFYEDGILRREDAGVGTTFITDYLYYGGKMGSEGFVGDLGELIIYDRMLTDSERLAVDDYLFAKWMKVPSGTAPIYNPSFASPAFKSALDATLAGTADTIVMFMGDSLISGYGSTNYPNSVNSPDSYPSKIVDKLRAMGYPAADGYSQIGDTSYGYTDARWSYPSGWYRNTTDGVGLSGRSSLVCDSTGTQGPCVYSPNAFNPSRAQSVDTFDVYYTTGPGLGNFTVQATGGEVVTVDGSAGANGVVGVGKVTVTSPVASSSNSVTITRTSGIIALVGITARHSTIKRILIGNGSAIGSKTTHWIASFDQYGSGKAIEQIKPHLSIIGIGSNDLYDGQDYDAIRGNLLAVGNKCVEQGGDVLYNTPGPVKAATEDTFEARMTGLRNNYVANITRLTDLFPLFGGSPITDETKYFDNLHPNTVGYEIIARKIIDVIT